MIRINRKINNRLGFTMIELLAVITIVGILSVLAITGVSRLIQKAKNEQKNSQEKIILIAAKSYAQDKKSKMPKAIGESVNVTLKDLKNAKYLKTNISNADGESCMKDSYVRVYKYSKKEYTYTTYLYCGNDVIPDVEEVPAPSIDVYFTDASGKTDDVNIFNNVSTATLVMNITGGKNGDEDIEIDGYSFSISYKTSESDELHEVYSSGTLSANRKKTLTIRKKLSEYVDVTKATYFNVKVTVRNVVGGLKEINSSVQGDSNSAIYNDTIPPTCSKISNQADANQWINKASVSKKRKITAECNDGEGSGCIRDTFTATWPNNSMMEAEYAYIQVKDNAGNVNIPDSVISSNMCDVDPTNLDNQCRVRVNVDVTAPSITLIGVNNSDQDGNPIGNNVLKSQVVSNDSLNNAKVNHNNYNIYGNWFNYEYSNGVAYTFKVDDNIHLDSWKWETNAANLNNSTIIGNKELHLRKEGTFDDTVIGNCGLRSKNVTVRFTGEGLREGKFTVKDKAGNETSFIVVASIDRTAPEIPQVSFKKQSNSEKYTPGNWTNSKIIAEIKSSSKKDSLSGFNYIEYSYKRASSEYQYTIKVGDEVYIVPNDKVDGIYELLYHSCDHAGNCTEYQKVDVKFDTQKPGCGNPIAVFADDNNSNYNGSWTNKNVKVIAQCSEVESPTSSGCDSNDLSSYTYSGNLVNITNGGPGGPGKGGKIRDKAGNENTCTTADKTIKIDKIKPTCTTNGESDKWRRGNVTISWGCKDNESGCTKSIEGQKSYNATKKTDDGGYSAYTISDKAGNTNSCNGKNSLNVYLDNTKPSCNTSNGHGGDKSESGLSFTVSCSDGDSGVSTCAGSKSNSSSKTGVKSTTTYTVVDKVGNSNTCQIKVGVQYNQAKTCKVKDGIQYNCVGTAQNARDKVQAMGYTCDSGQPVSSVSNKTCRNQCMSSEYLEASMTCFTCSKTTYKNVTSGSKCGWKGWGSTSCTKKTDVCKLRYLF